MKQAVLFCGALALIAVWPAPLAPASTLIGHPGDDVWNHVWGYWWVAEELLSGRLPLSTDLQGFPEVRALFFIDMWGAVITLPIQLAGRALMGPGAGATLAYNTAIFLSFWATGLGAWALAKAMVEEWRGEVPGAPGATAPESAYLAAAALTFSPHLMAQAYNGITETLNAFGLPVATLAMLQLYRRPTLRQGIVAGLAMALCVLANWYYGLFAVLGAGLTLAGFALARREALPWAALPGPVALAGVLSGVLVAPVLGLFAATLREGGIVSRDPTFVLQQLLNHNLTDVEAFFHPGKFYSPDLKATHGEELLIVVYLGWALLGLAGAGLWRLRRWSERAPPLLWIGVFGVLSLGPYLYVSGAHVLLEGRKIPLPFLPLFEAIPIFGRISHPFRFVVGIQLMLGVLASLAVAPWARWARWGAIGGVSAELLLGSPAVWPLPRADASLPAYTEILAKDAAPGAVLDLPLSVPNLERAVYLYWQIATHRPIPYALNEPLPMNLERNHLIRALLVAETRRIDTLPPMLHDLDLVVSGRALARAGYRYVVVHEGLYPPARLSVVRALLTATLGPATQETEDHRILWRLQPPEGDAP